MVADAADIAALELLAVEIEMARAVSIVHHDAPLVVDVAARAAPAADAQRNVSLKLYIPRPEHRGYWQSISP